MSLLYRQINGVDVTDAEHLKVVELLTGLERFVRICVERNVIKKKSEVSSSASHFSSTGDLKSPKVFGLPKPYTSLYSASSYMANRYLKYCISEMRYVDNSTFVGHRI